MENLTLIIWEKLSEDETIGSIGYFNYFWYFKFLFILAVIPI